MGTQSDHNYFYIRRLHSLLGIFPIGVFLCEHFFSNSFIFKGPDAFNGLVTTFQTLPLLPIIEICFIGLPIFFHAVLGLVIFYTGRSNFMNYGYYRNWAYFLQRITGVAALIFIVLHVWDTRIATALAGTHVTFDDMMRIFTPGWMKWFYVIGIVSATYHFTNGIATALMTWGITVSRRSQKIVNYACWGGFLVMSSWGLAILYRFVTSNA